MPRYKKGTLVWVDPNRLPLTTGQHGCLWIVEEYDWYEVVFTLRSLASGHTYSDFTFRDFITHQQEDQDQ